MIILSLLDPKHRNLLQQWRFIEASVIRVGRASYNHVVIDHALVSRQHLELQRIGRSDQDYWLAINHGRNGTLINGVFISRELLPNRAVMQLGVEGPLLGFAWENDLDPELTATPGIATPSIRVRQVVTPSSCNHTGNPPDNQFCVYCGQPLRVLFSIRQYQVLSILGKGGMGTTYQVWNTACTGQVKQRPSMHPLQVLKEMNADLVQIAKAQELFEREARVLSCLDHPGIPRFLDFFIEAGKKYLAMEMIHGEDLEKWVCHYGVVSLEQAIAWMISLCEILGYLHQQTPPIIHRDIKPANLMVRRSNRQLVVLDFGAVKEIGTPPGTCIGAEGYSAPEQNRGAPITQSDLYAVGTTLIFLLTGKSPQAFQHHENYEYRFDLQGVRQIPPTLQTVISRVTEPRAVDRYQTAAELAQALAYCV